MKTLNEKYSGYYVTIAEYIHIHWASRSPVGVLLDPLIEKSRVINKTAFEELKVESWGIAKRGALAALLHSDTTDIPALNLPYEEQFNLLALFQAITQEDISNYEAFVLHLVAENKNVRSIQDGKNMVSSYYASLMLGIRILGTIGMATARVVSYKDLNDEESARIAGVPVVALNNEHEHVLYIPAEHGQTDCVVLKRTLVYSDKKERLYQNFEFYDHKGHTENVAQRLLEDKEKGFWNRIVSNGILKTRKFK